MDNLVTSSDKIHYLTNLFSFLFHGKEIVISRETSYIYNSGTHMNIDISLAANEILHLVAFYNLFTPTGGNMDLGETIYMLDNNWGTIIEEDMYEELLDLRKIYTVEKRDFIISNL